MNAELCQIQNEVIKKYGLGNRTEVKNLSILDGLSLPLLNVFLKSA